VRSRAAGDRRVFAPQWVYGKSDYERVLREMRLTNGTLFPLPITLTANPAELPMVGEEVVLRNANNDLIAVLEIDEVFHWDHDTEACLAYAPTMFATR